MATNIPYARDLEITGLGRLGMSYGTQAVSQYVYKFLLEKLNEYVGTKTTLDNLKSAVVADTAAWVRELNTYRGQVSNIDEYESFEIIDDIKLNYIERLGSTNYRLSFSVVLRSGEQPNVTIEI